MPKQIFYVLILQAAISAYFYPAKASAAIAIIVLAFIFILKDDKWLKKKIMLDLYGQLNIFLIAEKSTQIYETQLRDLEIIMKSLYILRCMPKHTNMA